MPKSSFIIDRPLKGRFAPSPTGEIHAGTIFATLSAWLISKATGGTITLRFEDIDQSRSKQNYADAIMRDFESLGLYWDVGPIYQSKRVEAYHEAYKQLMRCATTYDCYCSRADITAANAPHLGEYFIYPKTCLNRQPEEISKLNAEYKSIHKLPSKRLEVSDHIVTFVDLIHGKTSFNLEKDCGDFIIRRSDGGFSYNLAVVVDDFDEDIDIVTRGYDLLRATPQQIYIQQLLGLKTPLYAHIPLFCDKMGKRLAKRNHNATFSELVARYKSTERVLGHIAYIGKLQEVDEPTTAINLLSQIDIEDTINIYRNLEFITYK